MAVVKKLLKQGQVSLSGAIASTIKEQEKAAGVGMNSDYHSIANADGNGGLMEPPPQVFEYLKEICFDAFHSYDEDDNGQLDKRECTVFFRDFHEAITEEELDNIFNKIDADGSGTISFDEFINLTYHLIKAKEAGDIDGGSTRGRTTRLIADSALSEDDE